LKKYKNIHFYNKKALKQDVLDLEPDVVIMATGSKPMLPCPPVRNFVYLYDEVLRGEVKFENKKIIVGGGGVVGCETANFLAENNKVTILVRSKVAKRMETLSKKYLLEELNRKNVKILTSTKIVDVSENREVIVERNGDQFVLEADALVAAFGARPFVPFTLEDISTIVVGDAKSVRNIYSAVSEGFQAAVTL